MSIWFQYNVYTYIYIYTFFIYSFIYLFLPNIYIYIYIYIYDLIFWLCKVCLFHTAFRSARAKPNPLNFLSQNSMVSESRCFSSLKGFGPFADDLNPKKLVMTCEWSSIGFTTLPNSRNNNDRKKRDISREILEYERDIDELLMYILR